MRNIKILFLSTLLSGCAFSAANHQVLGDNKFKVNAGGNIWDTEETLLKTINKRAKKLCGENNYEILGNDAIVTDSVDTGYTTAPTQNLSRTVKCLEPS